MKTFVGCSAVIYDSVGHVLIAQRSRAKKEFPLLWETIGGGLEPADESPEACIRREVREEIGCGLSDLKLFKVYVVRENENQHILIVFTARIEGNPILNHEIESIKWICEKEIEQYDFYVPSCKQKLYDFYKEHALEDDK